MVVDVMVWLGCAWVWLAASGVSCRPTGSPLFPHRSALTRAIVTTVSLDQTETAVDVSITLTILVVLFLVYIYYQSYDL